MAMTDYGSISQRTAAWAAVTMLAHAEPIIVIGKLGQTKPHPKNTAQEGKFRRPVPFAISTTPLVEGVTPVARQMQYEDVSYSMDQYGGLVTITDIVQDLAEDPVLKDAAMLSGEEAAETLEMVAYGVLKAGTNVFYGAAADAARSDVNDPITTARQRAVTRALKAQRAKKITSMLKSGPDYGVTSVEAAFVAVAHTDVEADIRDMDGFATVADYGSGKPICPEEIGKVEDVRYLISPLFDPFLGEGSATLNGMIADDATNVDVYPVIYFAKDAFGHVPLKGENAISPRVINPNVVDKSDPLGQRGFVSWKTYYVCVRLNETWMTRLEVGATDL